MVLEILPDHKIREARCNTGPEVRFGSLSGLPVDEEELKRLQ